jgi:hypothetical protein
LVAVAAMTAFPPLEFRGYIESRRCDILEMMPKSLRVRRTLPASCISPNIPSAHRGGKLFDDGFVAPAPLTEGIAEVVTTCQSSNST